MNQVIELLNSHRSIRKFTYQPVAQEIINTLVQAGQAAATSSFIQACTVIQVNDSNKRSQLMECSGGQAYVGEAPVFLVLCADMQRNKLACEMNDAEINSGYTEQFITATVDVGLFAQNLTVAAESLGLGAVYIGGIRNQIARVADLLELPDMVYPVFGICLGYPDQNPEVKPRLPVEVVLKQDSYNDSNDQQTIAEYDKSVSDYYRTRTGGNKDMTWSEQMSGMLTKEARPHMKAFLKDRGFLLK
ncbi:oxygen-insensitive NADPH nitroreductase [Amphritea balenae]|uniref:Oxygen-insensitive NADPH nitroreductase n=1 Tax=Amphritea balenae TaxID=452629 RepID=A0A3P1SMR4_9GAMM|nr:oxygen-insensitive NADPH nitroreductase [Amphritea balenae]RRC98224.1 oxygen-insensitive NADPH nitroreductase [Amphritea balenae]GGK80236.1 NADPH-dependent oxidoreductase [Amphritea balenae]